MQDVGVSGSPAGDVLPVGVPVLAQVSLAALSSCDLLLQGVSLVPHAGPGSQQPGVGCSSLPQISSWFIILSCDKHLSPHIQGCWCGRRCTDTQHLCEGAPALT